MSKSRAVLLVHDVVNYFVDQDPELTPILTNVKALLGTARQTGVPVVFAAPGQGDPAIGPEPSEKRLDWGSEGVDVPAQLGYLAGETIIRKPRWGAFFGSKFDDYLREAGCDMLIVCGLSLSGGVETTVRDAYNRDLRSTVVADACRCRAVPDQGWGAVTSQEVAKVTLSVLAQRFARIATTAEICAEWRRAAP
jgi:nicotinamidase-related amidase